MNTVAGTIDDADNLLEQLEAEAQQRELTTEEYIVEVLKSRHDAEELEQVNEEFREQLANRDTEIEELEDELAARIAQIEQLSERVEQAEEVAHKREERVADLEEILETRADQIQTLQARLEDRADRIYELESKVETFEDRLEAREDRITELERQLARRSQIEDKVEELSMEVREERSLANAPFFYRWWKWLRS